MRSLPLTVCLSVPLALSALAFAAETEQPAAQLDKPETTRPALDQVPPSKQSTVQPSLETPPKKSRHESRWNGNSPGFDVDFRCRIAETDRCTMAKATILKACEMIEKVLVIKQTIRVKAKLKDLNSECIETPWTGDASSLKLTTVKEVDTSNGKTYLYPKALNRQLRGMDNELPDMEIWLNSHCNFYFPRDERPIQKDEIDPLIVVLRRLMHGLGFAPSWNIPGYLGESANGLSPFMQFDEKEDGSHILTGAYEMIFDKFLIDVTRSAPISKYAAQFENSALQNDKIVYNGKSIMCSDTEKLLSYEKNSKFMLDLATKPGSIAFRTNIGSQLVLETSPNPFRDDYSMNHIDAVKYQNTPEFLMVANVYKGKRLVDMIDETGSRGPFGPLLLQTLETLGYTIRNRKLLLCSNIEPKIESAQDTAPVPVAHHEARSGNSENTLTFFIVAGTVGISALLGWIWFIWACMGWKCLKRRKTTKEQNLGGNDSESVDATINSSDESIRTLPVYSKA